MDDHELIAEFIRTAPSETEVRIEVKVIGWKSPYEPISSWVTAARVSGTPSPERLHKAVQGVMEDECYFQVCKDCGERKPVGWTCTDMSVCHRCAERNHGIVF